MGTGYTRNDTVNNIADGNIINASDLDGEFDAVQAAFDAATGHTHDGTTGEGAPIEVTGPAQEYVSTGTEFRPKANNTYDLGSSGNQWKDLYIDGTANLDAVDIDGGNIDGTVIGAASAAAGTFTTATATTGNITTVNATTVDTTNIEVTNIKAKDGTAAGSIADSTGVVTLASSVLTTTDINGGTIDGTIIGGASAAAGTFTTATATTGNITTVNATTVDSTNVEVTNIKAKDGTASATIADSTGVMTVASSVLTTADINGGTIDGTVIGGSTPAAISGTTITGTSFVSSGDMTFGDDDKAIFGVGSDLQIYHDGAASFIDEVGTGPLKIRTESFVGIYNGDESETIATFADDGAVRLYYDNAEKLSTTATGIDVTGDMGADTATISGNLTVDTNTLFVDAANNRVGIGTSSPASKLEVASGNLTVSGDAITTVGQIDLIRRGILSSGAGVGIINFQGYSTGTTVQTGAKIQAEGAGTWTSTSTPANVLFYTTPSASTSPAERMRITSTGLVGIGASSLGDATLEIRPASDIPQIKLTQSNVSDGGDGWKFHVSGPTGGDLAFIREISSSDSERMRITSAGNVGIGTVSPAYKLDVALANDEFILARETTNNITNGFRIASPTNASKAVFSANSATGEVNLGAINTNYFLTFSTNGANERMRIDSSGNVGIGTSAPDGPLTVQLAATNATSWSMAVEGLNTAQLSHIITETGGASVRRKLSAIEGFVFSSDVSNFQGGLIFKTTANAGSLTERMRIDGSGNLLVGTTTGVGARFQAYAAASQHAIFGQAQSYDWFPILAHNTATSNDNSFVSFGTEASYTQRGTISYNRAGGLVAYNTTSDYRAKDIAGPIEDASSTVLSLKPYMGTMKGATVERPMFVAHETQEIAPYAVTGEKDAVDSDGNPKYQQMDHSALVPLLTAALQEALTKIEALEARITALEA